MLLISSVTFGGGFVIASFIKKRFSDKLNLLEEDEMLDFIAIAQSCPGAIAVNTAVMAGYRIAGAPGMIAAAAGTVIPPVVILATVSLLYSHFADNRIVSLFLKGMQAGVCAVIFDVTVTLAGKVAKTKSAFRIVIMAAAFIAVFVFKVNVIAVIAASLAIGVAAALIEKKKEGKKV
ncbi:MAG: chromate transporter [Clostridia bacterium]|nr:chromate transporter [Clostridia bacterium]